MTQELYKAINEQMKILAEKTGVGASFYVLHNGERINYANVLSDNRLPQHKGMAGAACEYRENKAFIRCGLHFL